MNLRSITNKTAKICKKTGKFILRENGKFNKKYIEYKGYNNMVSYVDKEAEMQLVNALHKLLPEAGFITEENTHKTSPKTLNWIIDPLDGTTNFIHNLPCFAVSVGLIDGNTPLAGVIYEPNFDECFYSYQKAKSYCNSKTIAVSPVNSLAESLLATGFPYSSFREMDSYMKILEDFMKHTHGLRRLGSAAVDIAYVACGRFEGFFEYNLNSWDVAGGGIIVENAGGKVTDFKNTENYIFGKQIIAAGKIHKEMLEVIGKYFKLIEAKL